MQEREQTTGSELRVGDLMTHGAVRVLTARMSVSEAITYMRRYGHEGYPVVDGDRVLGVLTQGVLGRAAHHQLDRTPVGDLVIGSALTIDRDMPIAEARRQMLSHGLGQLPVVEAGRLIGILTRTDLLRAWGREDRPPKASLRRELEAALPRAAREALDAIAAVARARGDGVYLVGGLPRDLILHRLGEAQAPTDIDVVVEGDAAELALAVAALHAGRVRQHERFGTATWETPSPGLEIDLVTARAEFYSAPAVLPTVEPGSLHSDLVRRDFSINTLAIELAPGGFGRLVDRLGGLVDLEAGLIRALHPLSFVEDPTRILRAVRFEQRFGFRLEPGTRALAQRAGPWLTRTTGARIQAELRKAMAERDPGAVLRRLHALGVLDAVASGLGTRVAPRLDALDRYLASWSDQGDLPLHAPAREDIARWRLLAWLAAEGKAGEAAALRLDLSGRDLALVQAAVELRAAPGVLAQAEARASQVVARLETQRSEALCLAWLIEPEDLAGQAIWRYARHWSGIEPGIDGQDLAALGLAPGPAFGRVIQAVRDARLDGRIESRDEALALARRLVAELD